MEAEKFEPQDDSTGKPIEWEAFYKNYRKPGYIQGFEIVNKLGGGVFGIVFKARRGEGMVANHCAKAWVREEDPGTSRV